MFVVRVTLVRDDVSPKGVVHLPTGLLEILQRTQTLTSLISETRTLLLHHGSDLLVIVDVRRVPWEFPWDLSLE